MMCACACNGLYALRKCAMYTAHVYRHMITGAIRFCNLKMCHWVYKGCVLLSGATAISILYVCNFSVK